MNVSSIYYSCRSLWKLFLDASKRVGQQEYIRVYIEKRMKSRSTLRNTCVAYSQLTIIHNIIDNLYPRTRIVYVENSTALSCRKRNVGRNVHFYSGCEKYTYAPWTILKTALPCNMGMDLKNRIYYARQQAGIYFMRKYINERCIVKRKKLNAN